jgi:hypothetical protein
MRGVHGDAEVPSGGLVGLPWRSGPGTGGSHNSRSTITQAFDTRGANRHTRSVKAAARRHLRCLARGRRPFALHLARRSEVVAGMRHQQEDHHMNGLSRRPLASAGESRR